MTTATSSAQAERFSSDVQYFLARRQAVSVMIRLGVSIRSKLLFYACSEHSKRVRRGHNRSVPMKAPGTA